MDLTDNNASVCHHSQHRIAHSRDHFIQLDTPDPHKQRRQEMLRKYPEIKHLMGHETKTKYIVLLCVCMQLILAYYTKNLSLFSWWMCAYFLGATISHILFTAIHEVIHNLAFKSKLASRCFAILINLPLGIPAAIGFEKYHLAHHRFMGDRIKDVDIPLMAEVVFFNSRIKKCVWLLIQPLTYTLRPMIKWPQKIVAWEWFNILTQILFNITVYT